MKILHLTLKKKWFDMIESGEKTEEYREIKQYWINRLALCSGKTPVPFGYWCKKAICWSCVIRGDGFRQKPFDAVQFKNGYAKDARTMTLEFKGISVGPAKPEWSDNSPEEVFIIKLGNKI